MPDTVAPVHSAEDLLIIAGSNDPLLDQAISLHNQRNEQVLTVFGNLGSMGGIRALKQGRCHMATSHLLQDEGDEYNFAYVNQEILPPPVVVNFCRRMQGLVVLRDNPYNINNIGDLAQPGLRIVNRKLETGTRLLFDRLLREAGIQSRKLSGYTHELISHMDVGLAVLTGKADAGPCIQPVAELLGLVFLPWRWERYDLLITKERFFDPSIQSFLSLLYDSAIRKLSDQLPGYDLSISGKMIFPTDLNK